jgi:hypothetical protein
MAIVERQFAEHFAQDWIHAWNSHDLDRILAHYSDDFEFSSPKIVDLMGDPTGTLKGKDAIRPYWAKALARAPELQFKLRTILTGMNSIVLYYEGSAGRMVAEVFEFGDHALAPAVAQIPPPVATSTSSTF